MKQVNKSNTSVGRFYANAQAFQRVPCPEPGAEVDPSGSTASHQRLLSSLSTI